MGEELRKEIEEDPEYWVCMLAEYHTCAGRLTNEHALYNANKKVQKKHAIIKLCAGGHGVDQYQDAPTQVPKDMREWVALSRSTQEELHSLSKATSAFQRLKYLETKYGVYRKPVSPATPPKPVVAPMRDVRKKISTEGTGNELDREARALARANGITFEAARLYLSSVI